MAIELLRCCVVCFNERDEDLPEACILTVCDYHTSPTYQGDAVVLPAGMEFVPDADPYFFDTWHVVPAGTDTALCGQRVTDVAAPFTRLPARTVCGVCEGKVRR
jgi:hypothetical protein